MAVPGQRPGDEPVDRQRGEGRAIAQKFRRPACRRDDERLCRPWEELSMSDGEIDRIKVDLPVPWPRAAAPPPPYRFPLAPVPPPPLIAQPPLEAYNNGWLRPPNSTLPQ